MNWCNQYKDSYYAVQNTAGSLVASLDNSQSLIGRGEEFILGVVSARSALPELSEARVSPQVRAQGPRPGLGRVEGPAIQPILLPTVRPGDREGLDWQGRPHAPQTPSMALGDPFGDRYGGRTEEEALGAAPAAGSEVVRNAMMEGDGC